MQTQHGAPAAAAIETTSGKRWFSVSLLVDWNRNDLFDHALSDLSPWANSNPLASVSTDRSLSGTAPSDIMLIEGHAAAEMTFTIEGSYQSPTFGQMPLTAVFSPYNGHSPLYNMDPVGCRIIYQIGVETTAGTVWYDQFKGVVRNIQPKRSNGVVTISALDRSERLRHPVTLPVWALSSWHSQRGYTLAQVVDSQWIIDHCLISGDASPRPWRPIKREELGFPQSNDPRTGVQFWLSGNGSWLPNIGYPDSVRVQGYPWMESGGHSIHMPHGTPHPTVSAEAALNTDLRPRNLGAMGNDATGYRPLREPISVLDNRLTSWFKQYRGADLESLHTNGFNWIGFTLIKIGTNGTWYQTNTTIPIEVRLGNQIVGRIRITNGQARAELQDLYNGLTLNTAYVAIPAAGESVEIAARFIAGGSAPSGTKVRIKVGGTFGTLVGVTWVNYTGPDDFTKGIVTINHKVGMQDIYWQNRAVANSVFSDSDLLSSVRKPATYAAVLDRGLNRLTQFTTRSYDDAWQLISSVAAAELGSVFWDELGIFRFWNRETMLAKQNTIVRTLTLDHLEDLEFDDSLDSVRNIVTATARSATGEDGRVFESNDKDQFVVLATTQVYFRFKIDDMAAVTPWKVPRYATITDTNVPNLWTDLIDFGYVVQFETSPGVWQEQNHFSSGVDIQAFMDEDRNLVIRVWNGYSKNARFATNAGSPALRLPGIKIIPQDDMVVTAEDASSIARYGPRNLPIQGDWVQYQPSVITRLVDFLLARTLESIPTTNGITIPGDPRLQLGDTLKIVDSEGMGEELLVQILGIRRTYSESTGLRDTLSVELIKPSGVGQWDSSQYGRWDQTLVWSA